MKMRTAPACGQHTPPANAQDNRCLPFCGLGAAEALRQNATRCGAVLLEQSQLRTGELAQAKS